MANPIPDYTTGTDSATASTTFFTITAPGSAGIYNAYFVAYNNSTNCTGNSSATTTLTNAVTVTTTASLRVIKHVVNTVGGTATAGNWTLTVTSSNGGTGTGSAAGSETGTVYTLQAGKAYHVAESGGSSGYTESDSADCTIASAVAGTSYTCTITNSDQPGHIVIAKHTTGGDGSFGFNISGPSSSLDTFSTSGGSGNSGTLNLIAGTYSVTENVPAGWQLDSATCDSGSSIANGVGSITIANGQTINCTFVDTKLGGITVVKDVVAPDGSTNVADTHAFSITRDGGNGQSIAEGSNANYPLLAPGTYTIAELADENYNLIAISPDNDTDPTNGAVVTVSAGATTTVTISNAQKKAHLTVTKVVNNPNGGNATSANFTMSVTGINPSQSSFAGDGSGTTITLDPGAYSVGESGPIGYYQYSASTQCTGTAASNASLSCTIVNSDIPANKGVITVKKHVVNDNGGSLSAGSFTMTLTGQENFSGSETGTAFILDPGSYTIGENDPSSLGYTGNVSCVPVSGGSTQTGTSVTIDALADQGAYICTVTNDDIEPSLTLQKTVVNSYGGQAQASNWTLSAGSSAGTLQDTGPTVASGSAFQAGAYTLSEAPTDPQSAVTNGYQSGNWSCSGTGSWNADDSRHVTLGIGQSETCSITNSDKPAHLTIVKHTGTEGNGTFGFSVTGRDGSSITTIEGSGSASYSDLNAGTYSITETSMPEGWHLSDVSCTVNDSPSTPTSVEGGVSLALSNGDNASCTFTNTKKGTLIVKKVVVNDNGGSAKASDFYFKVNGGDVVQFDADGENHLIVQPGVYTIRENTADGYTTSYSNCSEVSVPASGEATCTITNNDVQPPTPAQPVGGGNGPIAGSLGGQVLGAAIGPSGQVLGASISALPVGCTALFTSFMRRSLKNDPAAVRQLQQFLNDKLDVGLPTTGFFGPQTEAAVRAFQQKYAAQVLTPWGLTGPTGFVYLTTQRWMNLLHCQDLNIPMPALVPFSGQ